MPGIQVKLKFVKFQTSPNKVRKVPTLGRTSRTAARVRPTRNLHSALDSPTIQTSGQQSYSESRQLHSHDGPTTRRLHHGTQAAKVCTKRPVHIKSPPATPAKPLFYLPLPPKALLKMSDRRSQALRGPSKSHTVHKSEVSSFANGGIAPRGITKLSGCICPLTSVMRWFRALT